MFAVWIAKTLANKNANFRKIGRGAPWSGGIHNRRISNGPNTVGPTAKKSLGRPRRVFRRDEALRLRTAGMSWRKIAQLLDVPMSTVIDSCRKGVDSVS